MSHRGYYRFPAAGWPLVVLGVAALWPGVVHGAPPGDGAAAATSGVLTLREALAAALLGHPELRALASEVRVREALALQAGLHPNPELRADVENVGGSGDRERFEETETTLRLSQLVELGGKRGRRQHLADLGQTLATFDYEAGRLTVLSATAKAFVVTLAAQERVGLATELERLAGEGVPAVERMVRAGAAAPVEVSTARLAYGRAALERARAERALASARTLLAAGFGEGGPAFERVTGDLTVLETPPPADRVLAALDHNPDLVRWQTERAEREAALAVAEAGRIPDVNVGAGGRHFSDNGDNGLVLELSVPLPLFDRNQGAIAAAQHRLAKVGEERAAAALGAQAALAEAYERLCVAHEQATVVRDRLLPDARTSFAGTRDAFEKGRLRSLDVLEAQRTLFALRGEYLTALETFHLAAADVERLTATPLGQLAGGAR